MSSVTGWTVEADGKPVIVKDPDASLRYWVRLPLVDGDTVDTIEAAAASDGVEVVGSVEESAGVAQFKVAGGTVGQRGSVTLSWVTAGGDEDQRTLYFDIEQR